MEDVLEVYERPLTAVEPVVCVDEGGKQLIGDVRPPLPTRPGKPARQDCEYERGGVSNLFMAFEPLAGWRHVEVTERKTSVDFARLLRKISDECCAQNIEERRLRFYPNRVSRAPRFPRARPPRGQADVEMHGAIDGLDHGAH